MFVGVPARLVPKEVVPDVARDFRRGADTAPDAGQLLDPALELVLVSSSGEAPEGAFHA